MVRDALGITWPETMSTAELTQRTKLIPLSRTIRKRRLRLVGHVIGMQSRLIKVSRTTRHITDNYNCTSGKVMVERQRFNVMLPMILD